MLHVHIEPSDITSSEGNPNKNINMNKNKLHIFADILIDTKNLYLYTVSRLKMWKKSNYSH